VEGAICQPNYSAAGRTRRKLVAALGVGTTLLAVVVLYVVDAAWPMRLIAGIPAAGSMLSMLQVRRNTCILHAGKGTFEHDDFSTTRASEAAAIASRKVAATIWRDALAFGAAVAVVFALVPR